MGSKPFNHKGNSQRPLAGIGFSYESQQYGLPDMSLYTVRCLQCHSRSEVHTFCPSTEGGSLTFCAFCGGMKLDCAQPGEEDLTANPRYVPAQRAAELLDCDRSQITKLVQSRILIGRKHKSRLYVTVASVEARKISNRRRKRKVLP